MSPRNDKLNDKASIEVLRDLDEIGAINLDILVGQASKVKDIFGSHGYDLEPGEICYKFTLHLGPRYIDLVSVAAEVQELGYQLERVQH